MATPQKIPKILHYCWYGPAPISELSRSCIGTWREQMPDFAVEKWDERRLDRSIRYLDLAYRARKFAFVADYMRFKALYEHGGVYLDTDVEVIRPLDRLLGEELFIGYQAPHSVGAGVIGAVKGHPFLRLVLDRLDAEARRASPSYQPLPELVSELAAATGQAGLTILPEDYFYPYNPYSSVVIRRKPLQSNMSERTLAIHHWEGAWLGEASLRMMVAIRLKGALRKLNPMRGRVQLLQSEVSRP